jgi:transposase
MVGKQHFTLLYDRARSKLGTSILLRGVAIGVRLQEDKCPQHPSTSFVRVGNHARESSASRMAPRLAQSKHSLISDMLASKSFKAHEIAEVAGCSTHSVHAIKSNLRQYGTTKAPPNGGGRPRDITPPMFNALCERLLEKPGLCQDEMQLFFLDEFNTEISTFSIGRTLRSHGWTKKKIHQIAKGRNADLRDLYLHNTVDFCSYHYVFVDESGCDKRIGFRRTGWSPLGVTPVQVAQF